MLYTLTLQRITPVTPDTVHLVFDRPAGYDFLPGQANHWGLDIPGFRDAGKPFTITSLPDQDRLEFVIKIYNTAEHPDHDGVTERIGRLKPGDKVFVDGPSGDIRDRGPGVFVAGGAGVTPFIPILLQRQRAGEVGGSTLIFSNKCEADIILRDTWESMDGLRSIFVTTEEDGPLHRDEIDAGFIDEMVGFDNRFYVCGPPPMMRAVIADLRAYGVPEEQIVVESKWLEG
ncbi:flavodoxin reductase [Acuticoccus sediminis]|uniref:Flavodoxin reductase n=2 Tax=Acuticoccus sediminis TaxID=2184697 RepID=A0A8B2NTI9_9HYPH|nr:flavodoxin reductase [Acuticoccus sediminis]